jgi:hypothetical protein
MIKRISLSRSLILIAAACVWSGLLLPGQAKGQGVSVSAQLDSTLMVIGGQMNLTLQVTQPAGLAVNFPIFRDTITKNIDVVAVGKPDTAFQNNLLNISQVYRITSFDSGLHYIPPFEFESVLNDIKQSQSTNSLALMVVNPFQVVDPEKGVFDIKATHQHPFQFCRTAQVPQLDWGIYAVFVVAGVGHPLVAEAKKPHQGLIIQGETQGSAACNRLA